MTPVQESTFTVNGYTLAAREWCPTGRHKVIALHGWLDNAASFDVISPLLNDCHIIALDLSGHGKSDSKPLQANYNIWDELQDILAVAEQLGWNSFHLLGHSRGAIMALLLAAAMPEFIQSLVLLDAVTPMTVSPDDSIKQLRNHLKQNRRIQDKQLPQYASISDAVTARCRASGMIASSAEKIVERGLEQRGEYFHWRSDPRLTIASAFKFTDEHSHAFLSSISVPCLALMAEEGLGKKYDFAGLLKPYRNIAYRQLPGSHHFHMEEQAGLIAGRITDLYESVEGVA
jgi:pimeloyl-ACP methyl ester carboxylesterase